MSFVGDDNSFDDLLSKEEPAEQARRAPTVIRVDAKLRNVDVDAWDDLLEATPKKQTKQKFKRDKPPRFDPNDEFSDMMDEAALALARRMAEWRPRALTLGYALVRCRCCGEVEMQQLGVFLSEVHVRSGARQWIRVPGTVRSLPMDLPREEDTLCEDWVAECAKCFMFDIPSPQQFPLPMELPLDLDAPLMRLCTELTKPVPKVQPQPKYNWSDTPWPFPLANVSVTPSQVTTDVPQSISA